MADEGSLSTLISKKELTFSLIQGIHDAAKTSGSDAAKTRAFLNKYHSMDALRATFLECIDQINALQIQIMGEKYKPSFQGVETVYDMCSYIQRKYSLATQPSSVSNSSPAPVVTPAKVKLPLLELKVFSGDHTEWPLWYESFKTLIHQNTEITNTQKVQYLLSKLSDTALAVCAGIMPTADNYETILQALVQKYDDKRTLALSYLDKLFKFKPIKTESSLQLNNFIDIFSASVAALKNLKIANLDDFIILAIALGKIDPETAKLFEMSVADTALPTFDQLNDFIKQQAKLLSRMPKSCVKLDNQQANSSGSSKFSHKNTSNSLVTHSFVIEKSNKLPCPACHKAKHPLFVCDSFLKLGPSQRYDLVKQNKACINCLNLTHIVTACKSQHTCNHCSLKHNTLLHFRDNVKKPLQSSSTLETGQNKVSSNTTSFCTTNFSKQNSAGFTVLLSTVKVAMTDANGKVHLVRMLLDSGSMSHFITLSCAKKMGLNIDNSSTSVQGIGSTLKPVSGQTCFTIASRFDPKVSYSIQALVVDQVTSMLPSCKIDTSSLEHLKGLQVSDDTFYEPQGLSGILGASVWPLVIESGTIVGEPNSPIGVRTKLGIVVMGSAPIYNAKNNISHTFCTFSELDNMVSRLWEIEQVPSIRFPYTEEEIICEKFYKNTVTRDSSGRFTVALPFKEEPNVLGGSYMIAKKRLLNLESKLEKFPELREGYHAALQDFIDCGHMSLSNDTSGVFIPHHAVVKASSSTPIRPVFDASASTTTKKSLNDILHAGPNIYSDLFLVLINFRIFRIAISADIRKMFRQIFIRQEDRKYQKILWRFSPQDPISIFTLDIVLFGVKCSPWLAQRTLRELAIQEANKFPLASSVVGRDTYMDDLASSVCDENEAKIMYFQLIDFFKSGGFELVKWCSNSPALIENIPESDRLHDNLEWEADSFSKILGVQWNSKEDVFCFKISDELESPCTKRSILSFAARIWDILGFLCPVIIKIKILLQQLWSEKLDWDVTPPNFIVKAWNAFRLDLQRLSQINIPRYLGITDSSMPVSLIGFADASEKAYACVIYTRVVMPNGDVIVRFLCAKSKVAPLKTISIPRLELCGALLLSQLLHLVSNNLKSRCHVSEVLCFSDSTVALNWIANSPSKFNVFVANRVSKLQQNVDKRHWYYCSGTDNPADCATRGVTPTELISSIWFSGPSWLSRSREEWNLQTVQILNTLPEEKKTVLISVESIKDCPYQYFSPYFHKFSSWQKLCNSFVYVLRFSRLLPKHDSILLSDLQLAEYHVIRIIQNFHFSHIFKAIQKSELLPQNVRKLNPFICKGIIRVGGRLANSKLDYEQKYPILLPQKEHVVTLLVEHYHKTNLHTGSTLLFSLLRNNYWIVGARNLVRKVVRSCNICFRCKPVSPQPFMGNLPEYRVQPAVKAFLHTGLDMGGPFYITLSKHRGVKSQKAYLCLFVCMSTKALHLELVSDLSTAAFLAALKRFLARRGPVLHLYSDNGTNYLGAKNQLDELFALLNSSAYKAEMQQELNKHKIVWKFSPAASPHMSGIWESGIKSVKSHLYKIIGTQILTFEELSTVLAQIECLLNSRPICDLSTEDASEPIALTPAHFLTYQPLAHLPSRNVLSEPANRLTRYELLDQMVQSFWKRWSSEYLSTLQVRQKWNKHSPPVTIGTLALIRQDSYTTPLQWLLGRVIKLYPGNDGVTRVVELKTKNGILKRPVVKLCPLPTQ